MSTTDGEKGLSLFVRDGEGGPHLIGGRCGACLAVFFPRQSVCPRCTGREIAEVPLSQRGKLFTYTEVHQRPPDYPGPVPYLIGRVQLPEGVFVLSQLKARKEDLRIHMEMELVVEPICRDEKGDEVMGYRFRPV